MTWLLIALALGAVIGVYALIVGMCRGGHVADIPRGQYPEDCDAE